MDRNTHNEFDQLFGWILSIL